MAKKSGGGGKMPKGGSGKSGGKSKGRKGC